MSHNLSSQQILDLKYHAKCLAESAIAAYWADKEGSADYHVSEMIDSLKTLVELSKGAIK